MVTHSLQHALTGALGLIKVSAEVSQKRVDREAREGPDVASSHDERRTQ